MLTVLQIAEDIVTREGGYVNDPDDPGGATNHGSELTCCLLRSAAEHSAKRIKTPVYGSSMT